MVLTHIARLHTTHGHLICGAENASFRDDLVSNLNEFLPDRFERVERYPLDEARKRLDLPVSYVQSLDDPLESANWHLLQGASAFETVSVIDWWTFLDTQERERIMDQLCALFLDGDAITDIKERTDVGYALEQAFPLIGRHGLERMIGDTVWRHITTEFPGQLSSDSQKALRNGKHGAMFEQFFKNFCARNGISCYKPSAPAFARALPDTYQKVRRGHGRLAGIPDFFIDKKNTDSLATWLPLSERDWEPDDRYAFVECKYNESTLSARQKRMIETLSDHNITTYLLHGTAQSYHFEQV